jgi:hypothetical protein
MGGPWLSGSSSSSRPCVAQAPWLGLAALHREGRTWGGGGWPKNPGTTTQCRHRPSPAAAQQRSENGEREKKFDRQSYLG